MKKIATVTVLFLLLASCKTERKDSLTENTPSTALIGSQIHLDVFNIIPLGIQKKDNSKVIVLDFWATWCGPCITSFSHLNQLQKKYSEDVLIKAVSTESLEKIKDFTSKNNYDFSFYQDNEKKLSNFFNIKSLPVTVILSKNNYFIWSGNSNDKNFEKILQSVIKSDKISDELLQQSKPSIIYSKNYLPKKIRHSSNNLLEYKIQLSSKDDVYESHGGWLNLIDLVDLKYSATPIITIIEEITQVNKKEMIYKRKDLDTISLNISVKSTSKNITYKKIGSTILQDLKKLFQLKITKKTKTVESYEFKVLDSVKLKNAEETLKGGGHGEFKNNEYNAYRFSLKQLAYILEKRNKNNYYFNSSIFQNKKYNFKLHKEVFQNINELKKQLSQNYGIGLIKTKKEINILEIK